MAASPFLHAQTDYYWNGADWMANPAAGGTGNWFSNSRWRSGTADGDEATWGDGNNAILAGTAGTVTLGTQGSTAVSAASLSVQTDGYIIRSTDASRSLTVTGPLTLGTNVGLTFSMPGGNPVWSFQRISFETGSSLRIEGSTAQNNSLRINLTSSQVSSGGSIVLAGTGAGPAGFVSMQNNVTLNTNILNDSESSATMLGANTSSNVLNYGGIISGSAHLQISAGQSGGNGTVILNNLNTYAGDTFLNTTENGVLRLGINNALPTTTVVHFAQSAGGGSANAGGTLDLAGRNQSVAALDGAGRGVVNTGASLSTLTIGAASGTHSFSGVIGVPSLSTNIDGANNNIAVTKTGGNTQILAGANANTYTGLTVVAGGVLQLAKGDGVNAISGDVWISAGTLLLGQNNQIANTAHVELSGGTFRTNGFNERLGELTLSANAAIDFGSGASILWFESGSWTAGTLSILNWTENGAEQLRFTNELDSAFLANIHFDGYEAGARLIDRGEYFEVVAVPEPALAGLLGLGVIASALMRRRRMARSARQAIDQQV